LDVYDKTLQPMVTLALACPGKDNIRFWPLPVAQPWWEEEGPGFSSLQTMNDLLLKMNVNNSLPTMDRAAGCFSVCSSCAVS
jgi:hypothetical protein